MPATLHRPRTSTEIMASLDYLMESGATTQSALDALKDQIKETRRELEDVMERDGVSSLTDRRTGRVATLRPVRRYVIDDQDRARSALNDIGELGNCLRLDARAVERVVKERVANELGVLPGIREEVNRQLSVGAAKGPR